MGDRRYGFFRCDDCGKHWESSHVYCRSGTDDVKFAQDCKGCHTACFPYRVERIRCSVCHETNCRCSKKEREERHVDPNKPHRADLCHKCRAGNPCH